MSNRKAGDHQSGFLGLSGQLTTNLELIRRHTFNKLPSGFATSQDEGPYVAIRLRRRKIIPGEASRIVLMEHKIFVRWLQDGGTPSLWISGDGKSVSAKFGNPESKTVSVARYIADCRTGQGLSYLGSHFDLRSGNLRKTAVGGSQGSLPKVKDVLKRYRACVKATMIERDLGLYLVHPERVDLHTFTETSEIPF